MIVLLDSGPLGLVTHPNTKNKDAFKSKIWIISLPIKGYKICVPEIAYYEIRRELIRAKKIESVERLDEFIEVVYKRS